MRGDNTSDHRAACNPCVRQSAKERADVAESLQVALLGTFPPRRCGLAEYASNLLRGEHGVDRMARSWVVAVDKDPDRYSGCPMVRFVIRRDVPADYVEASELINASEPDILLVQHEYGIYGGDHGHSVLETLRRVEVPVITTLHTVLKRPNPRQRSVLTQISDLSDALIVLSHNSLKLLGKERLVDRQVRLIPHGVPDVPLADVAPFKEALGLSDRQVLLTTGLLGPGKGIETMIDALPTVQRHHPDVTYLIVGMTHPEIVRVEGEEYRYSLERRIQHANLGDCVVFLNEFVSAPRFLDYLRAADLYIAPYTSRDQAVSGTLSYALSVGAAVVSTPFGHATELLADERGVIVPFNDSEALAEAITVLLDDNRRRERMRRRAYAHARQTLWKMAVEQHFELFHGLVSSRVSTPPVTPTTYAAVSGP